MSSRCVPGMRSLQQAGHALPPGARRLCAPSWLLRMNANLGVYHGPNALTHQLHEPAGTSGLLMVYPHRGITSSGACCRLCCLLFLACDLSFGQSHCAVQPMRLFQMPMHLYAPYMDAQVPPVANAMPPPSVGPWPQHVSGAMQFGAPHAYPPSWFLCAMQALL